MNNIHRTRSALSALTLSAALLTSLATPLRAADVAKAASEVTAAAPRAFGGQVAGAIHLTATVESINYLTREVILKSSDTGERKAITAGPEVQRLTEIHQGDTIEMVYAESVIVLVGDHAGAPVRENSVTAARAGADQKPGALVTTTTTVLATVEAVDHTARTATLKGPKRTVTVNVPADAVNFNQVKLGDSVYVEFTQAVAAAVTKSAPAPAK